MSQHHTDPFPTPDRPSGPCPQAQPQSRLRPGPLPPFKLILLVGFAVFTLQILAEIIKRAASLAGRPIETLPVPHDLTDHGV